MNQKEFALRVRGLRKEHELTQEDLADKLGVSRQTIFMVETGQCLPSLEHALKLAAIFNQTIDSLLNDEIDRFLEETVISPTLNIHQDNRNFYIDINLLNNIDTDNINAILEDDTLIITLPKRS